MKCTLKCFTISAVLETVKLSCTNKNVFFVCYCSYENGTLYGDIWAHGVNFPVNGPVMTKQIVLEEPTQEQLVMKNGALVGVCPKAYKLKNGSYYLGVLTTHYR